MNINAITLMTSHECVMLLWSCSFGHGFVVMVLWSWFCGHGFQCQFKYLPNIIIATAGLLSGLFLIEFA